MKTLNGAVVDRINYYFGKRNITQYKLAELSGVPYTIIKSIMQNKLKQLFYCIRG